MLQSHGFLITSLHFAVTCVLQAIFISFTCVVEMLYKWCYCTSLPSFRDIAMVG